MISQVVLFFLIITAVGIIILGKTINEKRLFILLPAGMVWGVSIYIFTLNITSKFLHGKSGIFLATFFLFLLGAVTLFSYRKKFNSKKFWPRFRLSSLITLLILSFLILTTIYFARLKMTSIFPAADSDMQWAYAASFARGNYPISAPWQPDLNPNYHLGAYFLEGAILSLFKLPLITIHALLNTYFLIAGSLFAMFIFWENKCSFRNLWLIIAALIFYISFGVIMFIFPSANFIKDIQKPEEILFSLTKFPSDIPAKGTAGASLVDLNSLSFLPARSLSLGIAFLALYFSLITFKNSNVKILSFVILLATAALVEESMFLPLVLVTGISILVSKQKAKLLKILIFTAALVVIQGGFFLDFIGQSDSAFQINLPFLDPAFMSQLQRLLNFTITSNSTSINWFIPGPLWLTLVALIYYFRTKNKPLGLLSLFSLASLLCFLLIEYKYSPSNNIRFYNFAFISAGTAIFYLLFMLLRSRSFLVNFLVFIILVPFSLIPTLLPELINQSHQINEARSKSTRAQILITSNPQTPFEQISNWANKFLPLNSRLIVIDTDHPSPKRSIQFQYKGLYTILGPQYIHTTRPEPGTEFYDLSLTLNPTLLKRTKAEYAYIESESLLYQKLPQFRKDDLANSSYFEILQSVDTKDSLDKEIFYRIYKVLPKYLDPNVGGKEIEEGTLQTLEKLIPQDASVYITDYGDPPKFSFWYRMAVILALKDKDVRRNLSQTDYQAIETTIPYKGGDIHEEYDFYILGPNDKPPVPSELIWSNLYANCWKRIY